MGVVVGSLDGLLSGLAWNTLSLFGFLLFTCNLNTRAGFGTTAGNVRWVASATSGGLNWGLGGNNWGSRSENWSSGWLFNNNRFLCLKNLRLFFFLSLL